MKEKVLVIPCNTAESIDQCYLLKGDNKIVMGASSVSLDFSCVFYDAYFKVPWITDRNFIKKMKSIVNEEGVDEIMCTHVGIYNILKNFFPGGLLSKLESRDLYGIKMSGVESRALLHFNSICNQIVNISYVEFKSLFCKYLTIPGSCSEDKFTALVNAAESSPQGDFVEIGSFYGKSALTLGWMAKRKGCNLLCIDPWEDNKIKQESAHEFINYRSVGRVNSVIKDAFVNNLYLTLNGNLNYIQSYSDDAIFTYEKGGEIVSSEFGATNYSGKIACLHIDGNHDYQYVRSDIVKWSKLVLPGGWIIIDDYNWCYGDGPKVAADEYIFEETSNIDICFFCGGALFIKINSL